MSFTMAANAWCRNVVKGLKFKALNRSGNGNASFAIDEYGRAWSWGFSSYYGPAVGQGNYNWDPSLSGDARFTVPENWRIISPRLLTLDDGTVKNDWVKFNIGESSAMGIDKDGALWGAGKGGYSNIENCGAFGLPHDSGEDQLEWKDGVSPRTDYQDYFFRFTRCAPGYTVKDFVHCTYYTLMIGTDDKLYFMGEDDEYGLTGIPATAIVNYATPTLVENVPINIKFLATTAEFNYAMYCFVTQDNKLYGVGEEIYDYFHDGTGAFDPLTDPYVFDLTRNLPDVEIVHASAGYDAIYVTLANGDVYGMGIEYMLGQNIGDSYYTWVKLPLSNIKYCEHSQICGLAVTYDGVLWSWGFPQYGTGFQVEDCYYQYYDYREEGVGIATDKRWKQVIHNYYNTHWAGIDVHGNLYAWGSQFQGPHLGIGTDYNDTLNALLGVDKEPVKESCVPLLCDIPDLSSVDFHWPRATHIPMPKYFNRS